MKVRLFAVALAVIAVLVLVAVPVLAVDGRLVPTKATGGGWFISDDGPPASIPANPDQKISFGFDAKIYADEEPAELPPVNMMFDPCLASGQFEMINHTTGMNFHGTFEGANLGSLVGEDVWLWGYLSVDGGEPLYFEVMFWDRGEGKKAAGPDRVDFWCPSAPAYYFSDLDGGNIQVRKIEVVDGDD